MHNIFRGSVHPRGRGGVIATIATDKLDSKEMACLQELQEQQISRLKEKMSAKSNHSNTNNSKKPSDKPLCSLNSGTFDDLDLRTHAQKVTDGKHQETQDESEKAYLRKEIEQLQLQASKMTSEMKVKENEIEKLKQKIEEERTIMAGNGLSGSATQKIVELSCKNRDLHTELARERNRTRQLQGQLTQLQTVVKTHELSKEEERRNQSDPSIEQQHKDTISHLEDQLAQTKQKATEYRNQCQLLKQDLKMAQKVLVKEVGEGINIQNIITGASTGWRGRAQQIIALQGKVSELQRQVDGQSKINRSQSGHMTQFDAKQRATVHKIESENKKRLQEFKSEMEQLQIEHSNLKQQCSALKARNKTLASENKDFQSQVTSLIDDLREKEKEIIKIREENESSSNERRQKNSLEEYDKMLKHIRSQLSHSEGERQRLQKTISELQSQLQLQGRPHHHHSVNSHSDNIIEKTSSKVMENEVKLPPIKQTTKHKKTFSQVRSSLSAGGLPGRQSNNDMEHLITQCRVAEIERDRLLGLSQLLQQRLDSTMSETSTYKQQLLSLQRQQKGESNKAKSSNSMESLQERLLIQEDENKLLKEALQLTQQQKIEDMKVFQTLLHNTRQMFTDALKKIASSNNQ